MTRRWRLRGQPKVVPCRRLTTDRPLIEAVDGTVFAHACKLGLEGAVSKRRDAPYQHGRSWAWRKIRNPASPLAMPI